MSVTASILRAIVKFDVIEIAVKVPIAFEERHSEF
jgi:hypothetical protein